MQLTFDESVSRKGKKRTGKGSDEKCQTNEDACLCVMQLFLGKLLFSQRLSRKIMRDSEINERREDMARRLPELVSVKMSLSFSHTLRLFSGSESVGNEETGKDMRNRRITVTHAKHLLLSKI